MALRTHKKFAQDARIFKGSTRQGLKALVGRRGGQGTLRAYLLRRESGCCPALRMSTRSKPIVLILQILVRFSHASTKHRLRGVCKKREVLANPRVEDFVALSKTPLQQARNARLNSTNNRDKTTMKKILLLATIFGCAAAITASAADAKENYDKMCAKCHGADGKGQTKMGQKLGIKDLTDAKVQADIKDDEAFKAIKEGLKDSDGRTKMKAMDGLSDDEIKALVAQVRSFKQ